MQHVIGALGVQLYDNATIAAKLTRAREIADRIDRMRHRRWVAACHAAHIDANMTMLHNCLLAFEQGKPWREVDYSAARLAKRLADDFTSGEIINRYYRRMLGKAA